MDFSYNTVYRTEGFETEYVRLTGAARFPMAKPGEDTWIFWYSIAEHLPQISVITLESRSDGGNGVINAVAAGKPVKFIPVDIDFVKENPATFWLHRDNTEGATQGDVNLVWHQAEVPEAYEGWVAPPEQFITAEDIWRLEMTEDEIKISNLIEARGIPAEIGAIHIWMDGYAYQKKGPYLWRRVPSTWTDEDPDGELPDSTARVFRTDGMWDPARKELHHKIIEEFFRGVDPVPEGTTPCIQIMMGLPAAGKSTMIEESKRNKERHHNHAVLDPDSIVTSLPEFQQAVSKKVRRASRIVYEEATAVNDLAIHEALKRRVNFTISGTGADLAWIQNEILPLAAKGYKISVWMPHMHDLDELAIRSEERGERTGRFVPAERTAELLVAASEALRCPAG